MKILAIQMSERFYALAQSEGIEIRTVQKSDLYESIESILSQDKINEEPLEFECPLIYMSDMSEQQMQSLSDKMKQAGIAACIQVGQTEHNLKWVLKDLLDEIMEEHQTFMRRDELMSLIKLGIQTHLEDTAKKIYLEQMLMQAYMLLQSNTKKEELEAMIQVLKSLIMK